MEDFQTPSKKQKTADITSGKVNQSTRLDYFFSCCLSLKGKEKAKPKDRFSE